MKRTTLLVDEKDIKDGLRLSHEKTASDLLRKALADFVRRLKARQILDYLGSGIWEGDLSAMRDDAPRRSRRTGRKALRRKKRK